jgi:hypothetical protein
VPSPADPVSAVLQYIDVFNKADVMAMGAMCANAMSILDGMAPHVWHGPSASQDWYRDVLIEGEHQGAKHYHVTLGRPLHANVTGDAAYVVVPATMTFKLKGTGYPVGRCLHAGATQAACGMASGELGIGQRYRRGFIAQLTGGNSRAGRPCAQRLNHASPDSLAQDRAIMNSRRTRPARRPGDTSSRRT